MSSRQYKVLTHSFRYRSLLLSACVLHVDAHAQVPETIGDDDDRETIIVTALKHDERLSRTGAPVDVLTGTELLESGTTSVDRLDDRLPSLTVQPTSTGNLIFIRGVGNFTLQPNSDPAVGYAYDGVFISRPMGTLSQYFDLDRVELVKGPQGVLYGRNASAGTINVEPRQPVLAQYSLAADLSASSSAQFRSEAALNLPIGSSAAFRISGASSTEDSLLKGYRTGPHQQSVRAQLKTILGDRLTVRFSGDFNRVRGIGIGTSYVGNYLFDPASRTYRFRSSGLPASEGIYSRKGQQFRETIFLGSAGRMLDAIASTPWQDDHFYGVHARIDATTAVGKLTIIPAWRSASVDTVVSGSPFGYRQREGDKQSSVEARLAGSRRHLDWLAGTFLFRDVIRSDTVTNLSSALVQAAQHYGTSSAALFGNLTFHPSSRTRLGAGARWTLDRKNYTSESTTLAIVCQHRFESRPDCPTVPLFPLVENLFQAPFPIPARLGPPIPILVDGSPTGAIMARSDLSADGQLVDRAITWRMASELDIGRNSLLYATIETGYRPGGFNAAVGFETYDPERITAYTLGLRHEALDQRFQLDLEAFWWNYRDQQVSSLRPDLSTPPRNANITDNIASSRIGGIEASIDLRPWAGSKIHGTAQFLHARYSSFKYVYANTGVPPLTGCATTLDVATNLYIVDCSAKQPYNSPRWSLGLDLRQSFAINGLVLTAVADTNFRSARNIGFAFLPQQRIGPTWSSDAAIIVAIPGKRLEIAAFVRNIEGRRTPEFMIYHPISNALVQGTSAPRQVGVRASLRLE